MEFGGNSFTNHPGIIDYKGHSYFTYHTGTLPGGGGFARSMCIEEMFYQEDGKIKPMTRTDQGPAQLETLNPFQRTEAETICRESGVKTEDCSAGGRNVCDIQNGEYLMVSGVDFGEGADIFNVSASSALNGGRLELHLDAQDGRLIGTVDISGTGGWQNWQDFSCEITGAEGIHDLYFTFAGEGTLPLYNLDWWQFADSSEAARIRGNVNGDGIINAVDLTLAKRGILNGFADRAAEKAADVDRNQITDAKHIAWFRQYLLVETSAYPDAGDDKTPA